MKRKLCAQYVSKMWVAFGFVAMSATPGFILAVLEYHLGTFLMCMCVIHVVTKRCLIIRVVSHIKSTRSIRSGLEVYYNL